MLFSIASLRRTPNLRMFIFTLALRPVEETAESWLRGKLWLLSVFLFFLSPNYICRSCTFILQMKDMWAYMEAHAWLPLLIALVRTMARTCTRTLRASFLSSLKLCAPLHFYFLQMHHYLHHPR